MRVTGFGIEAEVPEGWEARLYRRSEADPNLHLANFPLPAEDGDFGSGAVTSMPEDGIFLALVEYGSAVAGFGLFAARGIPRLGPSDLDPNALQRRVPGRRGAQRFFSLGDRAFCLYVVVGTSPDPAALLESANAVLRSVRVSSPR